MLKCSDCQKFHPETSFNRNKARSTGRSNICRTCLRARQSKNRDKVSKEEAEEFLSDLNRKGNIFKCSKCQESKLAGEFYYKRDRGSVYVNTTSCRECTKETQRFKSFGIDSEEYGRMLKSQDNCCAICKIHIDCYTKNSQNNKVFAVDHDHLTGKIRGLLCCRCNRGLGYFKDKIEFLENAISYLKGNDMV